MGKDLYLSNSNVRKSFEVANDIMGFDFKKIIFNGPAEVLKKTIYTQPAIYLISVTIAKILIKKGVKPQRAAGHSLGEYSALTIANAFDFESGFELVKLRSEAMQSSCEEKDGTMAAVLGLDDSASAEDIKPRYKSLAKKHHPDANNGSKNAEKKFIALKEAYNLLTRDPES